MFSTSTLSCCYVFYIRCFSARLKEEHIVARERAAAAVKENDEEPAVELPMSDSEGSILRGPTKANDSCGACRTRESDAWWRAPKGLVTNILCDTCGTNWRKYADLNVRPVREETLPPGKRGADKLDTPLSAPNTKRLKVLFVPRMFFAWLILQNIWQTSLLMNGTPPPVTPVAPQLRCLACQKTGPVGRVLKCGQCHFRVHAGKYTVASEQRILNLSVKVYVVSL